MSGGGSLRQSIGTLDGNLGREVRLDGSVGLHGFEVGDETVPTETHRDSARRESGPAIGSGAALPSGGAVKEGALSDGGSVVTKQGPSSRDPR